VQAVSGLMSINGTEESGAIRMGTPLVDLGTGLNAVIGILLAIHDRHRTGKGQAVDVSLYDSAVSLLHPHAANFLLNGKPPKRIGNQHPNIAPYDAFRTSTKPIFLAVGNNRQFERLCEELGAPQLAKDKRFLNNGDRSVHREDLRVELEKLLLNHDGVRLADKLLRIGVPAGAVLDLPDVVDAPHTRHREMIIDRDGYRGTGIPIKMSRTKGALRHPPRKFNEDGDAVLKEAGFSADEIAALKKSGTVPAERRKGGGDG
jgi:formyl-CoA transferase